MTPMQEKNRGKFAFYGDAMKEIPKGDLMGPKGDEKLKLPNKAKIFLRHYIEPPEIRAKISLLALHRQGLLSTGIPAL